MGDRRVRYARNGTVRLAYREFGEGDTTLVWIPGWFSNVEMYDDDTSPFAAIHEQLAEAMRVAVHIGARIGALAGAGEVLASRTVRDLSAGSGLTFEDRGSHRLKGIPEEINIFHVRTG